MNEETLFNLALEKSPHERSGFLDGACGGNAELRGRVERLLSAHDHPGSFLQQPALQSTGARPSEVTQALDAAAANHAGGTRTQAEPTKSASDDLAFLSPSTRPDSLGRLEHYEILEVIGKGGFGTVLKAFDEKLHRMVAIKVLSLELSASGTAKQRFIREARTAAAVAHEHVVTIHAVVEEHRPPYLVMQLIDGVTLQQKLDKSGTFGLREMLRIGLQMAQALDAAHKQGLVHRDIKPANILLENGVERVKITDFGLARAVDDASVTQSGTVAGTPMYMSPEQAEGLPIDHRSDLFSLGTVLYAMCTGLPPFRASGTHAVLKRVIDASPRPIREINNEIPDWLCAIIAKLHAKKPEDRFQTAKEVAKVLGHRLADVQAGRTVPGEPSRVSDRVETPEPATPPLAPPSSPSRRWYYASGAMLVILGVLVALAEYTDLTHFFHTPIYWVDLNVDDPNVTVKIVPVVDGADPEATIFAHAVRLEWKGKKKLALAPGRYWFAAILDERLVYFETVDVDKPRAVVISWAAECTKREKQKLQGTWHAVSGERDGSAIPADMIAEVNFALRFEGDRVTVRVAQPKETKATEKEGGFTIDPRKTLATLDLIDAIDGKTIFCVYRFTADALQICGSRKERPSDFSTKLGSERMLFVLKRGERALPKAFEEPGWVQLFNGKDLSGWKGDAPPWKWENRTLVARTGAPEAGVGARKVLRLRSEVKFKDFELRFEARRLDGFGRLHIRQQPSQETNHIQVHVGEGWGSVRPVAAVDEKVNEQLMEVARKGFKQEEYNKVSVLCRGKRVVVMVNGVTTYDGETLGPQEAGFVEWVTGWDSSVYFRNIEVKELPPEEPGWVQLFNGKDLTGWKTHPKQPEGWKVDKDGVLVGSGPYISHLFTGRDDFTDFHLRAQVKINDQGNSGIYFRIPFDVARGGMFPTGYEAQILNGLQFNPGQKSVEEFLTGSLYGLAPFDKRLVLPDTWFALEVIAKGNHIVIKVNDEKTVDYLDPQSKHTRGHLALQLISHSAPIPQPTVVHFKKIEIKELPPEEPGWVQLFNGKDLTGWVPVARKKEFDPKEVFHVNDNVLIVEGRKEHALLRTVKAYENYELEFEFRVPPLQTQTAGCLLFLHLQPDNTLGNLLSIDPNGEGFLIGPDRKDFEIKIKGKPPRDGGWSRIHLTCKGHEIGVRLNGEDLGIAKEKNSDLRKGFIAILPELNEVHYRNLRLRELKKAEIKEAVPSSSLMHGQSRVGAEADWLAAFKASERPRRKVGRLGGDQQHRLGDAHLG